jgi:hypothetical protein
MMLWLCTVVTAFGNNSWYHKHWCNADPSQPLEYLEDTKCIKRFPSDFDRDLVCPSRHQNSVPGYFLDMDLDKVFVNQSALSNIGLPNLEFVNIALILVRRDASGIPYYKYVGNNATFAIETWSSSKVFCVADGAGLLDACSPSVGGLDASTQGKHGSTPLGDLATVLVTYDATAGYTSNALGKWFATVGNHTRLNWIVQDWLGQRKESLGGSYGEPVPNDLKFTFSAPPATRQATCKITPDLGSIAEDTLSPLTAAELVRRMVLTREIDAKRVMPGLSWQSAKDILYGASNSSLFPGLLWGGMSADPGVYVQSGLNITQVDEDAQGQWRIFSKLGAGVSALRTPGAEIITNAYACLPTLTSTGAYDGGYEFVISARAYSSSLATSDRLMHETISKLVHLIATGVVE